MDVEEFCLKHTLNFCRGAAGREVPKSGALLWIKLQHFFALEAGRLLL